MQLVHLLGQLDVELGQGVAEVVGGQGDLYTVVYVEPLGVVVQLLRYQRHRAHPPESLNEVLELELLLDCLLAVHL